MVKRIVDGAGQLRSALTELSVSARSVLLVMLAASVVVSSLAVIYSAFLYRQAFNQQQQLFQQRNELEVEWGQLLLEQSALAAHGRVERAVTKQLGMYVPSPEEIVVVR
ncbi:cell division protein FtsL [Motiliproteus coralliicola]|uniref:Cell division protein FtsL n=1 Tax=Motiliproteus coralliicola TaxID=2283196 RepID=A0A369WTG0_9GAMM|nr:cell division protein FtsL [Motiliproteus coralliicola]RDE22785.1 cell division protein FtsL [Motiliproteus coralliicola]